MTAAIVQHEGLYMPLTQGVENSLKDHRLKMMEKEEFLKMLNELHDLVRKERNAGVQEDKIERRLMKAMKERLRRIMNLYSLPQQSRVHQ